MERTGDKATLRILGLLRILCLSLCAIASRGEAQVGLQVEAGLEGKIRPGRWAPVRVTVTNSGEPLNGRVAVGLPTAQTEMPLDLPTSANKRVETTIRPQAALSY